MLEAIVGVALRAILASVLLGGVLAALVFAATRVLALTAATRHALWTTALICTALMPVAGIGVSMWKAVPSAAVGDGGAQGVVRAGAVDWVVPGVAAAGGGASAAASRPAGTRAAMGGTRLDFMPRVSRDLAVAVVAIWGIGALAGLIGLGASIVRVRGLKRR
ncbi:MAG: hypothetical protein JWO66_920, partial [Candidatus Eremiobacteraeota bacterium]|nr:hypothetical protein [Candidatus Eremiobacteraeota bacterium]